MSKQNTVSTIPNSLRTQAICTVPPDVILKFFQEYQCLSEFVDAIFFDEFDQQTDQLVQYIENELTDHLTSMSGEDWTAFKYEYTLHFHVESIEDFLILGKAMESFYEIGREVEDDLRYNLKQVFGGRLYTSIINNLENHYKDLSRNILEEL